MPEYTKISFNHRKDISDYLNSRYDGQYGWKLSTRFERALNQLAQRCAGLQAPQSHETQNLLELIKNKQEKAHKLFKEAQIAIRTARFDNAHALLNQIKTLWPTMSELENIKRKLAKTQADYEKHMQKASQTYSGKHLTTALQFAESALGICPDSAKTDSSASK
ncbi:MAG: hypothetical protein JXB29_09750 [Sedimentisphaerales bacterium]|nr:hypothetical protein [Sedimentisphaerales bacterium]